jgi:hypothetical protein
MTEEQKKKNKEYNRIYYEKNKEKLNEMNRIYCQKNKEKITELQKKRYQENRNELLEQKKLYYQKNVDVLTERNKKYRKENNGKISIQRKSNYEKNKDVIKEKSLLNYYNNIEKRKMSMRIWEKNKLKNDIIFRLKKNLSTTLRKILKSKNFKKGTKDKLTILGTDYKTFKEHLEGLWEPWMSWDNYGLYKMDTFNYGWDIDHIIPTSSAKTEEEVLKLNHYTNLKPLCSKVNRDIKKDKV